MSSLRDVETLSTYLDHAATTSMHPEVLDAMRPWQETLFANPSGSHRAARAARKAVDEAREVIAAELGVQAGDVVFTGGGTESDNYAISGSVRARGGTAVCSAVEHHAVLDPVEHHAGRTVAVTADARIDIDDLRCVLDSMTSAGQEVAVVSVMAVNNEVGSCNDIAEVASVVRAHAPNAWLHTDAVQAACWVDLSELTPHVDLLSLSAHKFGGPKGVGITVVSNGVTPEPLMRGGGQERGRRSGTIDVAGAVGTATALHITGSQRATASQRVTSLRDELLDALTAIDGVTETVPRLRTVPGIAHICVNDLDSEALLFMLDEADVYASAASACASGAMESSHVLSALGLSDDLRRGALRLSLGHTSSSADIDRAISVITNSIGQLRERKAARKQRA